MRAEPGQMLSHYRLVEKIGEGGMGVVWKAEDTILNRTVAIKVLPADLALDEEGRRMFLDEARLAASVSHAHIVQVYELGRERDLDFIVMEYVEGQTLNRLLHGRPLSPDTVSDWGLQVAEGLARAHHKGLIHRDLKPANILVTPEGEVKIVDFGLAVLFERRDSTVGSLTSTLTEAPRAEISTRIAGTLPYMSPEQVRGEKLDARSDIFSFGTVLYELTTGQRPFTGLTPADIAKEIQNSRPRPVHELVPNVPLDLHRIIEKALVRRAADRYQHLDDVAVDLRRLRKELESGSSPSYEDLQRLAPARRGLVRLAVLPFQNLSAEGPHAYFAGGLHDELLTQLAKVAALKVISRTSVMGYQGTSKPLKEIASELGVGRLVEGSVQVVGERLRVNVQLIDAATDEHLWAERYDRTLDDAFAIQSEVAQQIVAAVGAALTGAEQGNLSAAPTANPEAYLLYLQGREYWSRPGYRRQDRESAQQLYERALQLDPNFALAHASLSQVHGQMYWFWFDHSATRAQHQREEAETALRLAPDLPQAHIAMGLMHYYDRRDYRRALDELKIALEKLPNDAELWETFGYVHRRVGHWNEVFAAFQKAMELNPRDADLYFDLGGQTYQRVHRYADAVRAFDRALSLAPDLHASAVSSGWTYVFWQGQLDTLRATLRRIPRDAELEYLGDAAAQRAALLLWERDADGLLQMLQSARADVFVGQGFFLPSALYAAWAHQLRGDHSNARAAFDSVLVRLDAAVKELPDDRRVRAARGMALAGLGRRDEARQEARWLQQSIASEDAYVGPELAEDRARILTQVGDADAALDEIERLIAVPSLVSVHTLALDPRWDPIRDHARFKALLAKYGAQEDG